MKIKKITALLLTGAIIASTMTGCGINKNAVAAKLNDKEISLGVVNFMCRYQQAGSDDMYRAYFGDDVWSQDLSGNGTSMQESVKSDVLQGIHELYTLQAHMSDYNVSVSDDEKSKIASTAKAFMEANDKATLDEIGATEEIVEEMLTLYTVREKMYSAIVADVDTNVTDAEANKRGYSYIQVGISGSYDTGSYVEYTEEEAAAIKDKVKLVADQIAGGATLEDAAKNNDYEVSKATYASDDETLDEAVKTALDALKEGETSSIIETDSSLFIARIDTDTDKEATEENRKQIIKTRKQNHYEEVLAKLQEGEDWSVVDKKIAQIKFDNHFSKPAAESTEAPVATESVDSTQN